MAENETMNNEGLENVAGGKIELIPDPFANPEGEYTCRHCGHKFMFRQPGQIGMTAFVKPRCPKCGEEA